MSDHRRDLAILGGALLCSLLLLAGCSKAQNRQLLPWFKIKTIHRPSIGGFADAVTTYESYVKSHGLWRKLENCQGGEVLNPDTVALSCSDTFNGGTALVRKGETVPRPACGSYASTAIVLPSKDAVDCFDVIAGRAPVVPTQLRYRRVDLSGRARASEQFSAGPPGRVFLGPLARFYGDDGTPYVVTYAEESGDAPDCALFALEGGALRPAASGPDLRLTQCYQRSAWSRLSGLSLQNSLPTTEAPASDVPTSPQKLKVIVR